MANVGDACPVGSICPETGRYKRTACTNTEIFDKGNKFAPWANSRCQDKGKPSRLTQKLT